MRRVAADNFAFRFHIVATYEYLPGNVPLLVNGKLEKDCLAYQNRTTL